MTEEAQERPRKIVIERIGTPDGLDLLTAKLAAAQAAVAPALAALETVQPAVDAAGHVSATSRIVEMATQMIDVELPEVRAARDRRHAARQSEQMLELLGDMLVEMRAQSQATSAAVVEARQNATMTRVVLVLSVLAFVTSTAFAVLAATSSWPAVALAGVLGICVCWILVRLYGRDVGRG